jgi:hypothetical protein
VVGGNAHAASPASSLDLSAAFSPQRRDLAPRGRRCPRQPGERRTEPHARPLPAFSPQAAKYDATDERLGLRRNLGWPWDLSGRIDGLAFPLARRSNDLARDRRSETFLRILALRPALGARKQS